MDEIVLKINGMKCTGCSQRLENALKNTDGIESAFVDLETREAKIKYNNKEISFENICEVVADIGFEVER